MTAFLNKVSVKSETPQRPPPPSCDKNKLGALILSRHLVSTSKTTFNLSYLTIYHNSKVRFSAKMRYFRKVADNSTNTSQSVYKYSPQKLNQLITFRLQE